MARSLIIGCGYVGSALAEQLVRDGDDVAVVKRSAGDTPHGALLIRADVGEPDTLAALPPSDTLFYTVAADGSSEPAYRAAYVDGLKNVIEALRRRDAMPRRLFVTTSTAVYAQDAGEWVDENSETAPSRFQGRILLESEAVALGAGVRAVCVRFGGIYGPGRTRLIDSVRRGDAVPPYPSYTNRIHRDDCAGVLRHLAGLAQPDSVYVGVDRDPADYRDVIAWLAERLGAPSPPAESGAEQGASGTPDARGKRCRSDRLAASGYRFIYPTFREGYQAISA